MKNMLVTFGHVTSDHLATFVWLTFKFCKNVSDLDGNRKTVKVCTTAGNFGSDTQWTDNWATSCFSSKITFNNCFYYFVLNTSLPCWSQLANCNIPDIANIFPLTCVKYILYVVYWFKLAPCAHGLCQCDCFDLCKNDHPVFLLHSHVDDHQQKLR